MFTWFLKKMPKEKPSLHAQRSSLNSSLDSSQVLLLHSNFRKSSALSASLQTSRSPARTICLPTQYPPSHVTHLVYFLTHHSSMNYDLPPFWKFFSHFPGSGT